MDLLNTLGKKESKTSSEGTGSPEPHKTVVETKTTESNASASAATGTKDNVGAIDSTNSQTSSKVEPTGTATPGDWTVDSALKEIKKLREENKHTREKYQDSVVKLKEEMESRISSRERELDDFRVAQKELQEMKDKEADKKRDLAEKVAHREAMVAELKVKLEMTEKRYQDEMLNLKSTVEQFRAEKDAQKIVQQKRLEEELATVPDKYKDVASLIVKGAGDPSDALLALSEAKIKGVFEDKTIIVNHSVPGAHDGARASKDRLEAADKEMRTKMTSQQKIGQALKDMKHQPNSAFRVK